MAKTKAKFVCQNCGTSYTKWAGRCENCGEWNTLLEQEVPTEAEAKSALAALKERIEENDAEAIAEGEKLRVRPDVGAVLREVQRHIPEDADAL